MPGPSVLEAAIIAANVYDDPTDTLATLIGGWEVSERKFEGVTLAYSHSGFKSQIYERTVDGKVEYVYAIAGTDALWDPDGKADVLQLIGLSEQYRQGKEAGEKISQQLINGESLTFVGHSLGGGIAALDSYYTGRHAMTFNAAGVSLQTMSRKTLNPLPTFLQIGIFKDKTNIDAYIMGTDPLNIGQNVLNLQSAQGTTHYYKPRFFQAYYNGHSIDNFILNLEYKSREDHQARTRKEQKEENRIKNIDDGYDRTQRAITYGFSGHF